MRVEAVMELMFLSSSFGTFYVPLRPNYQQLPTTFVTYRVTMLLMSCDGSSTGLILHFVSRVK